MATRIYTPELARTVKQSNRRVGAQILSEELYDAGQELTFEDAYQIVSRRMRRHFENGTCFPTKFTAAILGRDVFRRISIVGWDASTGEGTLITTENGFRVVCAEGGVGSDVENELRGVC